METIVYMRYSAEKGVTFTYRKIETLIQVFI